MIVSDNFQKFAGNVIVPSSAQYHELKKLVKYAKKHSPRFAELYKNIGDNFSLQDLPVTSKQLIMEDFDNWTTASDFTLNELKRFTADSAKVGQKFKHKYFVCKTSGSTGDPFYMVYNPTESKYMTQYMNAGLPPLNLVSGPAVFLYPISQHLISAGLVKRSQQKYPLIKSRLILREIAASTRKIISPLNQIQPRMLLTYPSSAEVLASEQLKGNLHLHLKEIVVGGETLSAKARSYIQNAFQCRVRSTYACTEAGSIAIECKCNHLHLHNPGLILEPVDEHNRPVPAGQPAHRLLVTVLHQKTVPLIRYELNDKVVLHNTPCPCGNASPWLEIKGRSTFPSLVFKSQNREVSLFVLSLFLTAENVDQVRRLQIILHGYDRLECRIDFTEGADEIKIFNKVKNIFAKCFNENKIDNVQIYLSDQKPQNDPKTGKFVKAYQIF